MSNIIPFNFENLSIRVQVDDAGQPWFNAADVCAALELSNPRDAIAKHVDSDDVAKRDVIDNLGRTQGANHVNESGLYALILGSTKDAAKRFKRWVTSEVLPSIRKTGGYQAGGQTSPVKATVEANMLFRSNASVARLIFGRNQALLSANQATYKITGINVLQNLGAEKLSADQQDQVVVPSTVGKQVGLSPQKINDLLAEMGLQTFYRDHKDRKVWELTEEGAKLGEYVDTGKKHKDGKPVKQIVWQAKVIDLVAERLKREGAA